MAVQPTLFGSKFLVQMRKVFVFVFLCFVVSVGLPVHVHVANAQSDNLQAIKFWGVFQPRLSYGSSDDSTGVTDRFGYGIRRARFRVEVALKNKLGVRYDGDFASGSFQSVDLFAFMNVSPAVTVRLGIMASAQPRAHIFTPIPVIDGFDRPVVAEQWAGSTIGGGGRDFGLDVQYRTSEWTLIGFLHNGDGSFSRSRGNFSQTISSESATGGIQRSVLAASAFLAHRFAAVPGLEVGGYVSSNPSKNPNTEDAFGQGRDYFSYAAHAYYGAEPGSQPFRLKLDLIGINYDGAVEQKHLGVSMLGAVRLNAYAEVFARYENVQRDTRFAGNDFISAGATFSLSKLNGGSYANQRATLGYSMLESPSGNREHLVVLQWQFVL